MYIICKELDTDTYEVIQSDDMTIKTGTILSDNWFDMNGYILKDFNNDLYEFIKQIEITLGDLKEIYYDMEMNIQGWTFSEFVNMYEEDEEYKVISDWACSILRNEERTEE